ncbi:MAG TPA: PTS IIA-like nitrogen regulatory protein PtsN [Beijerinckiaceae bacterium]|nr:PTS IIA-like nitrogen regulatory protein PtsN [Beijerinckiaceae bacterium]
MPLTELISADAIIPAIKASGKKQVLQEMSEKAAKVSGLFSREIFEALLQRERLGSTGVGEGVAIPHGKLPRVGRIFGVFARLAKPVDWESLDAAPVDLVFLLIAPESAGADHLKALARIARAMREPALTAKLRAARDASALYAMLTQETASHAA